jgi:hypothetical protein
VLDKVTLDGRFVRLHRKLEIDEQWPAVKAGLERRLAG